MLQKFHENPVPHIPTNSSTALFPSSCSPPPCANLSKLRPDSSTNNPGIAPFLKNNPQKPKQSVLLHCTALLVLDLLLFLLLLDSAAHLNPTISQYVCLAIILNSAQLRSSTGSQILLHISRKVVECHMNFIDPNGTSKSSARCLGAAKGEFSTGIDSEDGSGSIFSAHRTPPQVLRNLHRLVHEKCIFPFQLCDRVDQPVTEHLSAQRQARSKGEGLRCFLGSKQNLKKPRLEVLLLFLTLLTHNPTIMQNRLEMRKL
jgi:hypothetical protein